jgi:tetratricopeptide (TPR) repeat protein
MFLELNGFEAVAHAVSMNLGRTEYVFEVVRELDYRGYIDRALFHALARERPEREPEIASLEEFCLGEVKGSPPKPCNLPLDSIGSLFKGREAFLDDLRQRAAPPGRGTAIGSRQVVHGLGGMGKTRAVLEYAWRHGDDYTALLFVSALAPEELRTNLANLVGVLGINVKTAAVDPQLDAVLRWLEAHPGWLLIVDNVDTEPAAQEVQRLLPRLRAGHLLITARIGNWEAGIETLELDELAPADAETFLLDRTPHRRKQADESAQAGAIADALGRLALALEQAGAYIDKVRLSFAEYLQRWESRRAEVLHWHDPRLIRYPASVAVTWETTFTQLNERERQLLEILSWVAPEPILLLLFDAAPLVGAIPDPREALAGLAGYSLVRFDASGESVLVHRLVQEITRGRIATADRAATLKIALEAVDAVAVGNPQDVRTWAVWTPLAVHAEAVSRSADAAGLAEPTARLMNNLGLYWQARGQFGAVEPLFRRALAIDEQNYGPDHPDVARDLGNLAGLLYATNRLAEAEPLYCRALAIDEQSYGPDHPDVARDLNNLAGLLYDTNRLAEAEPLYRRALAIWEGSLGSEHSWVAGALNNLAALLRATNRLGEAEPLFRRALAIDEQNYGPDHPDVARDLNNLAGLLYATNRLAEAEPLYRRALAINEQSYGPDHPIVARALNNLAGLLEATNRPAEAKPLYRRALAINERSYGPDHPTVATDLNSLAERLRATNRLGEAEPLFRRVVKIFEASLGPDHPNVATALNNLALLLQATNRPDQAEPLYRRALAIDEQSYGPDHPEVARDLGNLAGLLYATNRLAEAEPLYCRALAIDEQSYGPDHPDVASCLNNLGGLLYATNRLGEAELLFRRALAIDEQSYGPDHPIVARDLNNLGGLLRATNRLGEAEPLFRRGVQILIEFQRRTGHEHPNLRAGLANYWGLRGPGEDTRADQAAVGRTDPFGSFRELLTPRIVKSGLRADRSRSRPVRTGRGPPPRRRPGRR